MSLWHLPRIDTLQLRRVVLAIAATVMMQSSASGQNDEILFQVHPSTSMLSQKGVAALTGLGFNVDTSQDPFLVQNPFDGSSQVLCFGRISFPSGVGGRWFEGGDKILIERETVWNPMGPFYQARLKAVFLHEAFHAATWTPSYLAQWKAEACGHLDGQAFDDCLDCMDDVIECHKKYSACVEIPAVIVAIASVCEDLEDTEGLTPKQIAGLQGLLASYCLQLAWHTTLCGLFGCVNPCGNGAPLPWPPGVPAPSCACV